MNKNNTLLHKIKGYRHGGWIAPSVDPSSAYAAMVGNLASAYETQIESVDRAKDREVIKTTNKNADDRAKERIALEERKFSLTELELAMDTAPLYAQLDIVTRFDPENKYNLKAGITSKVNAVTLAQNSIQNLGALQDYDDLTVYLKTLDDISAPLKAFPGDKHVAPLEQSLVNLRTRAAKIVGNEAFVDALISQFTSTQDQLDAKKIKDRFVSTRDREFGLQSATLVISDMLAKSKATHAQRVAAITKVREMASEAAFKSIQYIDLKEVDFGEGKNVTDFISEHFSVMEKEAVDRINMQNLQGKSLDMVLFGAKSADEIRKRLTQQGGYSESDINDIIELYVGPVKPGEKVEGDEELLLEWNNMSQNDKDVRGIRTFEDFKRTYDQRAGEEVEEVEEEVEEVEEEKPTADSIKGKSLTGRVDYAVSYNPKKDKFYNAEGRTVVVDRKSDAAKAMVAKYEEQKAKEIDMPYLMDWQWKNEYASAVKAVKNKQAPSVDKYLRDRKWTPRQIKEAKKQIGFQIGGVVQPQPSSSQVSPEETTDLSNLDVELDEILGAINELTV